LELNDISNQNWRAALALVVSVPPNLPGLIASIASTVNVGRIKHVYDFAWLFGVRLHFLARGYCG
jgi:NCS1 family nucleobase:cation symporter-1